MLQINEGVNFWKNHLPTRVVQSITTPLEHYKSLTSHVMSQDIERQIVYEWFEFSQLFLICSWNLHKDFQMKRVYADFFFFSWPKRQIFPYRQLLLLKFFFLEIEIEMNTLLSIVHQTILHSAQHLTCYGALNTSRYFMCVNMRTTKFLIFVLILKI